MGAPRKGIVGPDLSVKTIRRVDILFAPGDREAAKTLLYERCGNCLPFQEKADATKLERFRFAALKYSDGKLPMLESAVKLANVDWRDLLVAVGFANNVEAHRKWEPKPAAEPNEIDPAHLAVKIHDRLASLLTPLGFTRTDDEWRRSGGVFQTLRLQTGLTSRVETRFFLRVTLEVKPLEAKPLETKPMGILLHLPKLGPHMADLEDQGYRFRAGGDEEALVSKVAADVARYAQPWFERFTSTEELRRGFEDKTFHPHLPVEGKALIF